VEVPAGEAVAVAAEAGPIEAGTAASESPPAGRKGPGGAALTVTAAEGADVTDSGVDALSIDFSSNR